MFARLLRIANRAVAIWNDRQVTASAAAVAFFAVLSLAPTLVFATAAATHWLGDKASRDLSIEQLQQLAGSESADLAKSVLESDWYARFSAAPLYASIPSAILLLFGASGIFAQLRRTLHRIFERPRATGRAAVVAWAAGRLVATAGAMVGGVLFLAALAGSAMLHTATGWLSQDMHISEQMVQIFTVPVTVLFVFVVLVVVYVGLTSTRPPWRYVMLGALVSAIGFEAGRWAFAAYVSHSFIATAYGPASSVVAFLLWMYYTANIVLGGAVLAQSVWEETQ